jgi:type III secretion protein O
MAMIDELLFIKSFREQQAETVLMRSRAEFRVAQAAEEQAQKNHSDFLKQAQEDELRWYRELCARLVKVRDIEDVQQAVVGLRLREVALDDERRAKEREREQAQEGVRVANERLKVASSARHKFKELARQHHLEVFRESERKEEMELEELAGVVREREEWGGSADG